MTLGIYADSIKQIVIIITVIIIIIIIIIRNRLTAFGNQIASRFSQTKRIRFFLFFFSSLVSL